MNSFVLLLVKTTSTLNTSINTKEKEMKLLQWIKSLFASTDVNFQHYHVEAFVESKKPKTTAEVEFWIRHFEQEQRHRQGWVQ